MSKRADPEAQLHRAVAQYLNLALPKDAVWTTVAHGGGGRIRGAKLKAMGLRPGWPDIQILYRGRFIGIELKSGKGRVSPEQDEVAKAIWGAGGSWFVCCSVDQVMLSLRDMGIVIAREAR